MAIAIDMSDDVATYEVASDNARSWNAAQPTAISVVRGGDSNAHALPDRLRAGQGRGQSYRMI